MTKDVDGDEAPDETHGGYESLVFPPATPADPTKKAAVERSFHVIGRFLGPFHGHPKVAEPQEQEARAEDKPLAFLSSSECDEFISRGIGVDLATVAVVMAVEYEFMFGVGLIVGPEPLWVYYEKDELMGEAPVVDTLRLARDVEKRAGVPEDVAHVVLEWELRFLEREGFA